MWLREERADMRRHNGPDVRRRLQRVQIGPLKRFQPSEVSSQPLCGCLSDVANPKREQESGERRCLAPLDARDEILSGLLAHSLERSQLLGCQLVQIGRSVYETAFDQLVYELLTKAINV